MRKTRRRLIYLSDIDGLRAIAVLAVVLFHLKITGFDAGYVGVDIFFVISGFFISGLTLARAVTNTFRFLCLADKPFSCGCIGNPRRRNDSCAFYMTTGCAGIVGFPLLLRNRPLSKGADIVSNSKLDKIRPALQRLDTRLLPHRNAFRSSNVDG